MKPKPLALVTKPQLAALLWLKNRNGDGVFDKNQVLIAGGEKAPVMRATWNILESLKMVELYSNKRRVRITEFGRSVGTKDVTESVDTRGINGDFPQ
jgi:hypothetical protein